MSKNYAALARSVVTALGGVDNITAVTHCMTRLRFVIKDDSQVDSTTLKTLLACSAWCAAITSAR